MNKVKSEALSALQNSAGERQKIKEQLAKMDRAYDSTSKILEREACKELFAGLRALYEALVPGGSLHKIYNEILDSTVEITGYNPNWRTEVLKPEPHGIKIDDEGVRYLKGLLGGLLRSETEFYQILEKIVTGRRTPGNPFYVDTKAVKSGKK